MSSSNNNNQSEIRKQFRDKLANYRKRAGISQATLAAAIGYSQSRFSERLNEYANGNGKGNSNAPFFTIPEVAAIVRYLDTHNAFYTDAERTDLLCAAYPQPPTAAPDERVSAGCSGSQSQSRSQVILSATTTTITTTTTFTLNTSNDTDATMLSQRQTALTLALALAALADCNCSSSDYSALPLLSLPLPLLQELLGQAKQVQSNQITSIVQD